MKRHSKRIKWIVAICLLAVVAFTVTIVVVRANQERQRTADEAAQQVEERSDTLEEEAPPLGEAVDKAEPEVIEDGAESLDPATISSIDIPPADITVSYIKGVGGFEYEVLRSADGRKYVELRNGDLVGTKCSNDAGVFVSIVEAPNESEKATISKSTDVDGVEYGLSVASPTCTNDADLLERYQEAFVKPFTLLKKLD